MYLAWFGTALVFLICLGSALIVDEDNQRIELTMEKNNDDATAIKQLDSEHRRARNPSV